MILINFFKKMYSNSKTTIFILIFFICSCLFSTNIVAQKISYPKHQIGLGYSAYSGTGLNYLLEINKTSALQFSGVGYYIGDNPPDDIDFYGIIGGEYQHTIIKNNDSRIYGFFGFSMLHLEKIRTKTFIINDKIIKNKTIETDRIYNYGTGVGYEYKLLPQLSVSANIGLLYQLSDIADFSEYWDRNPAGTTYTGIGIGIAIRYVF
jgi:hypothetical protein